MPSTTPCGPDDAAVIAAYGPDSGCDRRTIGCSPVLSLLRAGTIGCGPVPPCARPLAIGLGGVFDRSTTIGCESVVILVRAGTIACGPVPACVRLTTSGCSPVMRRDLDGGGGALPNGLRAPMAGGCAEGERVRTLSPTTGCGPLAELVRPTSEDGAALEALLATIGCWPVALRARTAPISCSARGPRELSPAVGGGAPGTPLRVPPIGCSPPGPRASPMMGCCPVVVRVRDPTVGYCPLGVWERVGMIACCPVAARGRATTGTCPVDVRGRIGMSGMIACGPVTVRARATPLAEASRVIGTCPVVAFVRAPTIGCGPVMLLERSPAGGVLVATGDGSPTIGGCVNLRPRPGGGGGAPGCVERGSAPLAAGPERAAAGVALASRLRFPAASRFRLGSRSSSSSVTSSRGLVVATIFGVSCVSSSFAGGVATTFGGGVSCVSSPRAGRVATTGWAPVGRFGGSTSVASSRSSPDAATIVCSNAFRSGEPGAGGGIVRCFFRGCGSSGAAAAAGSAGAPSTDQPDARSSIRLLVASLRRRRVRSSSATAGTITWAFRTPEKRLALGRSQSC